MKLQTLDYLTCRGKSNLSGKIRKIQQFRGVELPACLTTHAACIIQLTESFAQLLDIEPDPNGLYVCETTTLNKWAGKRGLQINPFNLWLANYQGEVWAHRWSFDITLDFNKAVIRYILKRLRDPKAQKYESGIPAAYEFLMCMFGIKRAIIQTAELHCTEWIAELLKEFKFLADKTSNNRIPPFEWWPQVIIKDEVRYGIIARDKLIALAEPEKLK